MFPQADSNVEWKYYGVLLEGLIKHRAPGVPGLKELNPASPLISRLKTKWSLLLGWGK
jgi:hypothetical protein